MKAPQHSDDQALHDNDGAAAFSAVQENVIAGIPISGIRGKLTVNAPLAKLVWFKSGGAADYLFEPADTDDLRTFLQQIGGALPIMALGLGSNLIIRDGGVPGVVVRLGKSFAAVADRGDYVLECGGGASGILVSSTARDCGIAGMEFLRGIPGTVGGFVRMNGGAYGREVADILIDCQVVTADGKCVCLTRDELEYSYRHSSLPSGAVVISARFQGKAGDKAIIGAEMDRIAQAREDTQPLRSKTGGSTFKNPQGAGKYDKAWQLVDAAGCRGMKLGGAQVSQKHTNFLINTGDATSADIEGLGELVRGKVKANSGVMLEWEIKRVGRP